MKKKFLTLTISLAALMGLTAIGGNAQIARAESPDLESLLNVKTIQDFEIDEDGTKKLRDIYYIENNEKGYKVKEDLSMANKARDALIPYSTTTYEYDENNRCVLRNISLYDQDKKEMKPNNQISMTYDDAGRITSYTNKVFQEDGSLKQTFIQTISYNAQGLVLQDEVDAESYYGKTVNEYNGEGKLSKTTYHTRLSTGAVVESGHREFNYDPDGNVFLEIYTIMNTETSTVYQYQTTEYEYDASQRITTMVAANYGKADVNLTDPYNFRKTSNTYNKNEKTSIIEEKVNKTDEYVKKSKQISDVTKTKEIYTEYKYNSTKGEWELSWGSKYEFKYSGNRYLGSVYYDLDDKGVYRAYDQQVITYTNSNGGFPIGAIIGIVLGAIVILYVVAYVLWKKQVLAFLGKPAFTNVFGWFDKVVLKVAGLFKKK